MRGRDSERHFDWRSASRCVAHAYLIRPTAKIAPDPSKPSNMTMVAMRFLLRILLFPGSSTTLPYTVLRLAFETCAPNSVMINRSGEAALQTSREPT